MTSNVPQFLYPSRSHQIWAFAVDDLGRNQRFNRCAAPLCTSAAIYPKHASFPEIFWCIHEFLRRNLNPCTSFRGLTCAPDKHPLGGADLFIPAIHRPHASLSVQSSSRDSRIGGSSDDLHGRRQPVHKSLISFPVRSCTHVFDGDLRMRLTSNTLLKFL